MAYLGTFLLSGGLSLVILLLALSNAALMLWNMRNDSRRNNSKWFFFWGGIECGTIPCAVINALLPKEPLVGLVALIGNTLFILSMIAYSRLSKSPTRPTSYFNPHDPKSNIWQ